MENLDALIGANLAKIRGEVSQQDLAEKMRDYGFKWSQATLWAIEKGERPLRLSEAVRVARILGVDSALHVTEFLATPGEMKLVEAMSEAHRAKEIFDNALESYFDALDNIATTADLVSGSEDADAVPGYRWGAVEEWLADLSPTQTVARASAKRELTEFSDDIEDEMIDRKVRTFRELVEARDAEAREQGFEDYETMWKKNFRTVGNYSGMVRAMLKQDPSEETHAE